MYHDPKTVLSPKNRVKSVEVIFDKGPVDGSWSVARVEWDGSHTVGIRWNGDSGNSKGTPQSRGNPAWFIVPQELEEAFWKLQKRKKGKRRRHWLKAIARWRLIERAKPKRKNGWRH